jgi:putative membrane protein
MRFFVQLTSNILVSIIIAYLIPGIEFTGYWWKLLIIGLILGIINYCIRPLLKFFLPPFLLITLGFFTVIINISCLAFLASASANLAISGFWPAFWGIVIFSLTNYSINTIIDYKD